MGEFSPIPVHLRLLEEIRSYNGQLKANKFTPRKFRPTLFKYSKPVRFTIRGGRFKGQRITFASGVRLSERGIGKLCELIGAEMVPYLSFFTGTGVDIVVLNKYIFGKNEFTAIEEDKFYL